MAGSEIGVSELAGFFKVLKEAGHFPRTFPTGKPVLSLEVITPRIRVRKNLGDAKDFFQRLERNASSIGRLKTDSRRTWFQ